jgi:predicted RecB family nuclease
MSVREFLLKSFDQEYEQKPLMELRKAPVSAMSGISKEDATSLKNAFGIDTVEELAQNKHVLVAQAINTFSKHSGKILDKEFNSTEFEELRKKPVSTIAGVSDQDATLLKNSLGINTIQDLAENKYIKIAQLVTVNSKFLELSKTPQSTQQTTNPQSQQPTLPKPPT